MTRISRLVSTFAVGAAHVCARP